MPNQCRTNDSSMIRRWFDHVSTLIRHCVDIGSTVIRQWFDIHSTSVRQSFDNHSSRIRQWFDNGSTLTRQWFDIDSTLVRHSFDIHSTWIRQLFFGQFRNVQHTFQHASISKGNSGWGTARRALRVLKLFTLSWKLTTLIQTWPFSCKQCTQRVLKTTPRGSTFKWFWLWLQPICGLTK